MSRKQLANTEIERYESEFEHILDRPDFVLGSTQMEKRGYKYFYTEKDGYNPVSATYVPAVLKLFDEVISNSVDEAIRTKFKHAKKILVNVASTTQAEITIKDTGRGIPIEFDKDTDKWVPELVFSTLRTGSNFDDDSQLETLGRFGVGVSLTNLFSHQFKIKTCDGKHTYSQTFQKNLVLIKPPVIKKTPGAKTYTQVEFMLDWDRFHVRERLPFYLALMEQRVRDLAMCFPEITFYFGERKVSFQNPKQLFEKNDPAFVYGTSEKCQVAVLRGPGSSFETVSWVNGIETFGGGTHVEYVTDLVVGYLKTFIKKKFKIDVRPAEIKNRIFLFLSLRSPKTSFDSQAKERYTTPSKEFSDRIDEVITEKFLKGITKNQPLIDSIVEVYQLREQVKQTKEVKKLSKAKKLKIPKLIEAQSNEIEKNILMICEGDSAISELINVRNPHVGGIPIRGKLLNVFDKKDIDVIKNDEIRSLMQCLGLEIGKKPEDMKYGKIGFLTDMDTDGNSIAGLLINFFYKYWPELFKDGRVVRVLSPLYTATNKKEIKRFYSKADFEKAKLDNTWKIKYNKGLGSLGAREYELVLNEPEYIELVMGKNSGAMLELVYSSDTDGRKEWLNEVR